MIEQWIMGWLGPGGLGRAGKQWADEKAQDCPRLFLLE
jgi:hypothetical protein